MCTLIVLSEVVEGFPLVIAANRDERYDRESLPPHLVKVAGRPFIRPWDQEKDGTWLGVAQNGWFVGLTNQDDGRHDEHALSRGKVVSECLYSGTHRSAAAILKGLDVTRYNPFNMVFGRPGAMFLSRICPGCPLEMEPLPAGISVISNDCCGSKYECKVDWAKRSAQSFCCDPAPEGGIETICRYLLVALSSHRSCEPDPFQALCVHADEYAFGTKSTSIITVSSQMDVEYRYSEGHPCQSPGLSLVGRMEHA